ncbi:SpoIIE family protein phosphatase [Vicingaceae bacterium]|nr:SpoIIE family protein phosphatase [Vicingaceae bacterium]
MFKNQLYKIVCTVFLILSFLCLKAAKKDTVVHFSGKVYQSIIDTDKKLTYKNAIFKLLKTPYELLKAKTAANTIASCVLNGEVIYIETVKSDGGFKFDLLYGKEYKIELLKEGYCLSTIVVDTRNVPLKFHKKGLKISTEVDVIKKEEGIKEFNFPMIKIVYDNVHEIFKEDEDHNLFVYSELERTRIELTNNKALAKEVSRLSEDAKKTLYKDIEKERANASKIAKRIVTDAQLKADSIIKSSKAQKTNPFSPLMNFSDRKTQGSDTVRANSSGMLLPSEMDMSESIELDDKKNQVKNAKKMLEFAKLKATTKMDSLLIIERESKILAAENEILLTEQKLKDVERTLMLQSSKAKEDKMFRNILMGGIGLMLILAFVLFGSIRRKKKDNETILLQKMAVEEQHKEIKDSINYAEKIQTALLTTKEEWSKISNENFIFFKPRDVVSGDFFWAHHDDEKNISIWCVSDCTGHGVPGAFMSMLGIGFLNEIIIENKVLEPDLILNELRNKIIKALGQNNDDSQQKDGMDLALCVWDKNNNTLEYAGANNSLCILRNIEHITADQRNHRKTLLDDKEERAIVEYKADKQPVGAYMEILNPFTSTTIPLFKGDTIISFTDGFPDQFGGIKGKKFKYRPFKELFLNNNESLSIQCQNLEKKFNHWQGDMEQTDDVCVVAIKV